MAESKGLRKRHSELQKTHYKSHPARVLVNKIRRLKTRIRRNLAEIKRKARRNPPRIVKVDKGAVAALKRLTQ